MRVILIVGILFSASVIGQVEAAEPWLKDSASSASTEASAVEQIPFQRISGKAQENIRGVVDRPSFFRRLPTQTIQCDPELFAVLVRYPEIIVNIWDLMGITKVEVKRVAPYVFSGQDGAGTACQCELLYGTSEVHVYYGTGAYSGSLAPREIDGRCVSVLHSAHGINRSGKPVITISMDIFLKLQNFGADLVTRTLGPLVGRTADYNFVESAKFVEQLNQLCEENPYAAAQLAQRLNRVDPAVRAKFSQVVARIAATSSESITPEQLVQEDEPAVRVNQSLRPHLEADAKRIPAATTTLTQRDQPLFKENKSSRGSVSASLSDEGKIAPAKPPIYLRR